MFGISSMTKVFVYGTLKNGQPNHHWLAKAENGYSKLIGEGVTSTKYPLVIASKYNIPFLLDVPGTGNNVVGEVYEVDEKMLSNLDILEGYPDDYTRRVEDITMKEPNLGKQQCWAYFLNGHKPCLLELPMMSNYSSNGPHGLVYKERYDRDPNYHYRSDVQEILEPKKK